MSNSSIPIESAMDLIKADRGLEIAESGDNVEKVLPLLAVPALFGAYGAARSQGMHGLDAIGDPDKGFFEFDPNTVRYEDPILGMTMRTADDPTLGQRALGLGIGAMQGLNPFSYARLLGRGAGAAARGLGPRVANLGRRLQPAATDAGTAAGRIMPRSNFIPKVAGYPGRVVERTGHRMGASTMGQEIVPQTDQFGRLVLNADGSVAYKVAPKSIMNVGKVRGAVGRLAQHSGPLAAQLMTNLPDAPPPSTDFGTAGAGSQSGAPAFGQPADTFAFGDGAGMGNLSTGYSQMGPENVIFDPTQVGLTEQQQRFVGQQEYKGENMSLGDDLLNKAKENMYKEKEGKKPKKGGAALILVMGHGKPGPSTEGKRDKLDSDKAE